MIFPKGTTFEWNGHVVALLNNIGMPEFTVETEDTTTHDSTSRTRDFEVTLMDGGSIPIAGFMDETDTDGQQAMYADAKAGTKRTWAITGPNSEFSMSGSGVITNIKPLGDAPVDKHIPFSATVKVSGAPTLDISVSTGMSSAAFSESGVVAPAFAIGTYEYVVNFLTGVESMTITPTAADHTITVEAGGVEQTVASGVASSAIDLGDAGDMTEVKVTVKEVGKAAKTYTFWCVRAAA